MLRLFGNTLILLNTMGVLILYRAVFDLLRRYPRDALIRKEWAELIVSFRQRSVIERSGLSHLGWGRKDAPHRIAIVVNSAVDFGFARDRAA